MRHAEACAAAMAVCPFDLVAKVLDPVIKTDVYPRNQASIKMLTKLVEHHSTEITDKHLETLMPGLIQVKNRFFFLNINGYRLFITVMCSYT